MYLGLHLTLIRLCLLMLTNVVKILMVGENWNVFAKRLFVVQTFAASRIKKSCKKSLPPLSTPMSLNVLIIFVTYAVSEHEFEPALVGVLCFVSDFTSTLSNSSSLSLTPVRTLDSILAKILNSQFHSYLT